MKSNKSNKSKRKLPESIKKIIASEQEWKCAECRHILPSSYQVDHKIPFSICENDEKENLVALCPNCHSLKTQSELKRISSFKKLRGFCKNQELCWYCLEIKSDTFTHKCNEIVKDIDSFIKKYKSAIETFEEICDKYTYIPDAINKEYIFQKSEKSKKSKKSKKSNKSKKSKPKKKEMDMEIEFEIESEGSEGSEDDLNLENLCIKESILTVKIDSKFIYVGHYFTKITEKTIPNDIAEAITVYYENEPKKYDKVEIHINIDSEDLSGSHACKNYLEEIMPTLLDKDIFGEIQYKIGI